MSDITLTTTIQGDLEEAGTNSHLLDLAGAIQIWNLSTLMAKSLTMEKLIDEGECAMIGTEIESENGNGSGKGSVIESEKEDARGIWTVNEMMNGGTGNTCGVLKWNVGQAVMLMQTAGETSRHGTRAIGIS